MKQQYYNPQLPATHINAIQAICAIMTTAAIRLAEAFRMTVSTGLATDGDTMHSATCKQHGHSLSRTTWHRICRIILVAALVLTAATPAMAQEGLNVNKVFQRFGHAKGCKMVEMHDAKLKGYELKVYKSLTYKKIGASIEPYLKADKKNAKKIREVVENGQVVSGYYMMPPKGKGINRYILFSKVRPDRGTVIYIEGALSPDDIMKLCYA